MQIDRNNATYIENPSKARTGVGDKPCMQCCPFPWSQERSRPHWEPICPDPKRSLRWIHHYAGSFVRLLFPIQVGPSANFCTTRNRNMFLNHVGKPSIYLSVCMSRWGLIPVLTGVTHDSITLLGYLRVRVFPGELSLANVLRLFSRNGREPRSSIRNGTSAVNLVYVLLSSRAVDAFGSLIASRILDGAEGVLGFPRGDSTLSSFASRADGLT